MRFIDPDVHRDFCQVAVAEQTRRDMAEERVWQHNLACFVQARVVVASWTRGTTSVAHIKRSIMTSAYAERAASRRYAATTSSR